LATTSTRRPEHYNYFRDYDPAIGRYIESDPIGLAGGLNTFAYVYLQPLELADRDGRVAGPAGDPEPEYRWRPDPRDWDPESVDGKCMLACLAIDMAVGHGFLGATSKSSNFMAGSSSAGYRVAGKLVGIGAHALGHTAAGKIVMLGHEIHGCEGTCQKRKQCEIPDWAKSYQHMPLPQPFPR
jgi:RHS repeat-associated protein